MHIRRGVLGRFMLTIAGAALLVGACGGDDEDDLEDIRKTATAIALLTPSPSPAPTVDPLEKWYADALTLADDLASAVDRLNEDMLAAQQNQADPNVPATLTADADIVILKAAALKVFTAAAGAPEALAGKIAEAADGLTEGANLLKEAIAKLDPAIGQQSADTLDAAEKVLDEVRAELAAAGR